MTHDTDPSRRHRTFSWSEIQTVKTDASKEDYLQGWVDGRYAPPPYAELMNIKLVEVSRGRAVFVGTPAEYHYNPMGTVHGGVLSGMIDSACGIACMSLLPFGTRWTTVSLNVSFLKMANEAGGLLRCEGNVVNEGQRIIIVDAVVVRASDGEHIASGRATCMTLPSSR